MPYIGQGLGTLLLRYPMIRVIDHSIFNARVRSRHQYVSKSESSSPATLLILLS